jgi:hypothetical protein
MRSKLNYLLCFLALALPASAQLDSAQLRAKFGAPSHVELRWPLSREIFRVPPGFDLVVDLTAFGYQVCKLQVSALMPTGAGPVTNFGNYPYNNRNAQNTDEMSQKMHAFLAELVPDAMRGKEMGRRQGMTGAFSGHLDVIYEHVTITQTESGSNDTITVQFKNAACQKAAAH